MSKVKFWLVGLALVGTMVYLVTSTIQATGSRYLHVHELADANLQPYGNAVKVTGTVAEGSFQYNPRVPSMEFLVKGSRGETVRVAYQGVKPDALQEGGQVIVEGVYESEGPPYIRAHTVLAKCPSRYKSRYKEHETAKG